MHRNSSRLQPVYANALNLRYRRKWGGLLQVDVLLHSCQRLALGCAELQALSLQAPPCIVPALQMMCT